MKYCLRCGGLVEYLGKLGTLIWYRCQACGIEQAERNKTHQKKGGKNDL